MVDDSQDILDLTRVILETAGYEVFTALSGKEALALLDEIHAPHLILLDVSMDEMSGTHFLDILERRHPFILDQVPVILFSGLDQITEGRASGFIRKPVDVDRFLDAVRGFISRQDILQAR